MQCKPLALIMIRNNPSNLVFLLFFLLFRINFLALAQNTTLPVNVGVILNLDTGFGKMGLSCIEMALSDFYASHAYYHTRLVLHKRDSANDVVVAAGAALDLINNVKVQAIIGPQSSIQAKFVTELGDKAQVPIISFSATSPSLGNSYFIRIAQNDTSQVIVISAIIQAFGWSEAVPISVDDEFGKGVIPYLTTALQAIGARIPYWVVIPSMATDKQIDAELDKLMKMKTRVFIVHMLPSLGSRLFSRANAMGMMEKGFAWIVTNDMTSFFSSSNYSVIDNMQGVLGLKTYVPNTERLENFRGRWQRKFQQDNPTLLNVKLDVFGLWAYDAAWALATAVEKVQTNFSSSSKMNISGGSTSLEMLEISQSGPELVQELWGTRFTGLSGDFNLIDGQLQSSTFQVVNVNDNGERGVGYWTPQNGLVRNLNSKYTNRYASSNASLGTIIWPGDTTSIPHGWQIPMSGMKLKVLVPVKSGFKEFVNVTYDRGTNTSNVTGYCIEVFEAVIKSLSYPVPYEFYPFAKSNGESAGGYNDLIDQVFLGNYDAAVGDITIRANRSLYVDFTLPYTGSGISMVVPIKDKNDARSTWVFLKPLTWELWVAIGCFFVFTGFVVLVLEHRINKEFRGPPLHQIGTSLWFSFSTMVYAQRERVVTNLARFVVIVWCFVVLILTQSYTASFSSILTVQQLQPVTTDVNLLLKNGDNVGYPEGSFIYAILKETGFQDANLWKYTTAEELDELLQNGNGKHGISAAFEETPYMKLFLATYCSKYTIVEPTFKADGFAFVFQKGSILTRDVSTAITSLHEGTEMKKIEDKWFKNKATCSDSGTTASSNSLTLSLDNFRGLFIVAGVVSSLSLVICAAMFFHEHRHTLRSIEPEISIWSRIHSVMSLYDQRDPNWDTYNGRQQQPSVHGVIGAVEASPNTISPPRPSSANDIEHEIELTSPDEERPVTH
uniref:glutamate receptor 2.8-like n=1 Tax=Fragaria vesca subsp. vesca TaxID=101020 RepID=UPI0005C828AB|nr:PREDICTED: glutamate receptor 2.8-like [Fragaria vesca subsp. vesca]